MQRQLFIDNEPVGKSLLGGIKVYLGGESRYPGIRSTCDKIYGTDGVNAHARRVISVARPFP
jgi:hypothetical protein